jgi:hypothetical protein
LEAEFMAKRKKTLEIAFLLGEAASCGKAFDRMLALNADTHCVFFG